MSVTHGIEWWTEFGIDPSGSKTFFSNKADLNVVEAEAPQSHILRRAYYDPQTPPGEFQRRFLRDVVAGDSTYYGGIAALLSEVVPVARVAALSAGPVS